ncbi:WD40-repeat-containing domain protein [Paraphysoderma sedebokerense]|nr:WD40-repeat-containing domain protein [Paraphysoderma sedebokerense]
MVALPTLHYTPISPITLHHTVSFNVKQKDYVFDIASTTLLDHFAVSASNHEIKLYDYNGRFLGSMKGSHNAPITQIEFERANGNLLFSSSKDGTLNLWDLRDPKLPAVVYKSPKSQPITCFSINSDVSLMAGGTDLTGEDAAIVFWDPRSTSHLHSFVESHSDDITCVHFHPSNPHLLLSGSTDGLACVLNVQGFDEDEAIVSVLNTESSVNRVNWFGQNGEYIYTATHIEELRIWNAEGEKLFNYGDVRGLSDSYADLSLEYMVNLQYDSNSDKLYLLSGSHGGQISIFNINGSDFNLLSLLQPTVNTHNETIRTVHWDFQRELLMSGSEDSKLCIWRCGGEGGEIGGLRETKAPSSVRQKAKYSPY